MKTNNPSGLGVSIEGHTDHAGMAQRNKSLSQDRVQSVMGALIAAGIDKKHLNVPGRGQEKAMADSRTEGGMAKNRRVEILNRRHR